MATPAEKIKRLRLPFADEDPYARPPKPGSYGGKQGPLTEAIRAKRARQTAKAETPSVGESSGRSKESAMGSMKNVDAGRSTSSSSMTFKQAFADARKSGQDQFTWNGKRYTTELAKPKKAASEEVGESKPDSELEEAHYEAIGMKKGGCVKMAKGGSASSRADGCAVRGKTKGRMV